MGFLSFSLRVLFVRSRGSTDKNKNKNNIGGGALESAPLAGGPQWREGKHGLPYWSRFWRWPRFSFWMVLSAGAMVLAAGLDALPRAFFFSGGQYDPGEVVPWVALPGFSPALWTLGLFGVSGALLLRFFHPLVVIPTLLQSMGCLALAGVLGLAQSYARTVEDMMAQTRGDLMLTRKGRDFAEYRELQAQLESMSCVDAAVPILAVSGLAYPPGEPFSGGHRPMAKAFVLRGIRPEDFQKSRVRLALHSVGGTGIEDIGPQPADRQRLAEVWMGRELARSLGLEAGQEVILSVRARQALRDAQGLRYEFSTRERRFLLAKVLDLGDEELNGQLALTSLSAAQALAHGRSWVSAIDIELCSQARSSHLRFAETIQRQLKPPGLYSVSSWRHSPERIEQILSFRVVASVVTLGLFVACALSVALGTMVLVRLRRAFFQTVNALGASPGQMRSLAVVMVAIPLLGGAALGLLWFWIITLGPALKLPLGLAQPVTLKFFLAPWDLALVVGMVLLSLVVALPMLLSELKSAGEKI